MTDQMSETREPAEDDVGNPDTTQQEVATVREQAPAVEQATGQPVPGTETGRIIDAISRAASDPNTDADKFERLMGLYERMEAWQSRNAFEAALASARAELPLIRKNREVDFTSNKGRTHYKHEDLGEIVRTVSPILAKHGLSFRWKTEESEQRVSVTCIISHQAGYTEHNTLSAPKDDSGNKNAIQAVGSASTYLQRYTLKAALGLAAAEDDDGNTAGGNDTSPISADQAAKLQSLVAEVGADEQRFLNYYKIEKIADLPAEKFEDAKAALEAKRKQQ